MDNKLYLVISYLQQNSDYAAQVKVNGIYQIKLNTTIPIFNFFTDSLNSLPIGVFEKRISPFGASILSPRAFRT